MSSEDDHQRAIAEVLPKQGFPYAEGEYNVVLCKPKIMALKSVTLERLDNMQKAAQDQVKAEEKVKREASLFTFGMARSNTSDPPARPIVPALNLNQRLDDTE